MCAKPRVHVMNAHTWLSIHASGMGVGMSMGVEPDREDREDSEGPSTVVREARDCQAMDSTGTRCPGNPGLGFAARTERTSV